MKRGTKEGIGFLLNILFVLGIAVLLQYLSYRHSHEWDFTQNKRFSLSPLSQKILSGLNQHLTLWLVIDPSDHQTRDLAHQYEIASRQIKVETIDPRSEPQKARELGISVPPPLIIAKLANREEQIVQPDEEKITNALQRLTAGVSRNIYFITGHGEGDSESSDPQGYSQLRETLTQENFAIKTFSLLKEPSIPKDATAVLLIAPKYALLPNEANVLKTYLENGGHLLFLAGIETPKPWIDFLAKFGFQVNETLVVDPSIPIFGGGSGFLASNSYTQHPITLPFLKGRVPPPILLPLTRSVVAKLPLPKGLNLSSLVTTSGSGKAFSYKIIGKRIVTDPRPAQTGVISVACVVATTDEKKNAARIVVIGSSFFADNQWFNNSATANQDFILNTLAWLGQTEDAIDIHPKQNVNPPLLLDQHVVLRLILLTLVILPAFGVVLGISAWLRRRIL